MDWMDTLRVSICALEFALRPPGSIRAVRVLRHILPYALVPVTPANAVPTKMIWVNRRYKPIGTAMPWATYEDYPHLHVDADDPRIAPLLLWAKTGSAGRPHDGIWLYTGSEVYESVPRARQYLGLLTMIYTPDHSKHYDSTDNDLMYMYNICETDYCTRGRRDNGRPLDRL